VQEFKDLTEMKRMNSLKSLSPMLGGVTRVGKLWRKKESPFSTYKELREEDWARFVAVGTNVLVHDGHDWARKSWSTRGMSGHEISGPLRACLIHLL
jgi:hypothetical protein